MTYSEMDYHESFFVGTLRMLKFLKPYGFIFHKYSRSHRDDSVLFTQKSRWWASKRTVSIWNEGPVWMANIETVSLFQHTLHQHEIVAKSAHETRAASLCRLAELVMKDLTDASDLDSVESVITSSSLSSDELFCTSVLRAFDYLMDKYDYEVRRVSFNGLEATICFIQRINRMRQRKVMIRALDNYQRVSVLFTERSTIHRFSDKTAFVIDADEMNASIETLSKKFYCKYLKSCVSDKRSRRLYRFNI